MMRASTNPVPLLIAMFLAGSPAFAHPHIFIDGGADFIFGADGKLERLRIIWVYDPFYSMTNLLDYGLDPDGDGKLDEQEQVFLADSQTAHWIDGYEGDAYLSANGVKIKLGKPENATSDVVDGQIRIVFERAIVEPFHLPGITVFKAYDPTYYVAYAITQPAKIENATACEAVLTKFHPDLDAAAQLEALSKLGTYENPEDMNVGEVFADRIELSCD